MALDDTTYAKPQDFRDRYSKLSTAAPETAWQEYLNTAAQIVDELTRGYKPGYEAFSASSSETRYFDDVLNEVIHPIDDLLTVSAVTRNGVTVVTSDYQLHPYNRANRAANAIEFSIYNISTGGTAGFYHSGVGYAQIAITGTWGYCTQANRPPAVKEAALKIAKQLYDEGAYTAKDMMQAVTNPANWVDRAVKNLLQRAGLMAAEGKVWLA